MVPKTVKGRRRYIAFRITGNERISLEELETILKEAYVGYLSRIPKIIEFDGTYGIIRCSNLEKEKAIEMLNRIKLGKGRCNIETLKTSGTLKSLRSRTFKYRSIGDCFD
jgi:RNase P/RNase MRP subunit POP5